MVFNFIDKGSAFISLYKENEPIFIDYCWFYNHQTCTSCSVFVVDYSSTVVDYSSTSNRLLKYLIWSTAIYAV